MTIAGTPRVVNGCLMVRDKKVLTGVPANVVVSPAGSGLAFLGVTAAVSSSRHVFTLGVLEGHRFLSLFRFKIWWMIPRVGKSGGEIPIETQMLLLEAKQESALQNRDSSESCHEQTFYILLLPILDGPFRATLQGTPADELQFCVESGDAAFQTSQFLEAVFVNSGDNP